MTEKAYYVKRRATTVTTFLVYATSAREARELAENGRYDDAIDSITDNGRWTNAFRCPEEDRS